MTRDTRHYSRNPKCRSRLPAPVGNEREAFCARGCHGSFYRHRCQVCEGTIEQPKRGIRLICKKAKCRNAWNTGLGFGRYHTAENAKSIVETPDFIGSKPPLKTDRGIDWAVAVNRARIRAPRKVLDAVFGRIPPYLPPLLLAA